MITRTYKIHEVTDYINWLYFFHAWQLGAKMGSIADIHGCDSCRAQLLASFPKDEIGKATEAMQLFKEAQKMLNQLDCEYKTHAAAILCEANGDGDDLILNGLRIPLLRQQTGDASKETYLCLSDFVRPLSQGIKDTVGVFATCIDPEIESLYDKDPYKRMLVQTLADRLAEATAEKFHEEIRRKDWGYAPDERLTMKQLLNEDYQGIRPAVGYPSLPDQSVIFLFDKLLDMGRIGIKITESGAMLPHASVCGLMFAHPQAQYFTVGHIDEIQLNDYAKRCGKPVDEVRRFLAGNI